MTLTIEQAESLAERTLAAIAEQEAGLYESEVREGVEPARLAADRERVASDLAGLRQHLRRERPAMPADGCRNCQGFDWPCPDACRYSDGLLRTARPYGVAQEGAA